MERWTVRLSVRGDAIPRCAGPPFNVVAGIGIGVVSKHMDISLATSTFTLLSVGNALVTTVPAFGLADRDGSYRDARVIGAKSRRGFVYGKPSRIRLRCARSAHRCSA